MDRKEKIYEELKSYSRSGEAEGLDAQQLAELTGIDRANVSRKLNELEREGRVIKLSGRPVRYMEREVYDKCQEKEKKEPSFFFMIGQEGSLKKQIEQAKAAILYPPRGLRTLFLGPTGTGKTMLVERIYEYGKSVKALDEKARLIVFNCAEYAENPQLILAQLFGYKKGAFTGADRDSEGLVEKADGGVLFLDEIHRLPPDGQEMLFMLMDRGVYRRLGEPDRERKANVLIMGATTENIEETLLQTFLRRMPVVVTLPSLEERPIEERLELIEYFFRLEQKNIGMPMYISKEVLVRLLQYSCPGNIGQLRADIQMICARGFLEYKVRGWEKLEIRREALNENVLMSDIKTGQNYLVELLKHYDDYYVITGSPEEKTKGDGESVFSEIIQKYNEFQEQGKSGGEIKDNIGNYLQNYTGALIKKYQDTQIQNGKNHILNSIDPKANDAVEDALYFAELKLGRKLSERMRLGLKLHVNYMMERLEVQEPAKTESLKDIAIGYPKELQTAKLMRKLLEEGLGFLIPDEELWILTIFLCERDEEEDFRKIGLIVLAHGNSTASSMADVANTLFDTEICKAVDMPLNSSIEETLDKVTKLCKELDEGKGILLLTDMGSLSSFGKIISEENGQNVLTVDMVTTITVVEAVRKALLRGTEIEELQADLNKIRRLRLIQDEGVQDEEPRIVITTCISGMGTAKRIKEMIQRVLLERKIENVVIKNMDITDVACAQTELRKQGITDVIAVVGTVDLKLSNVPYISIESLVMGSGLSYLEELLVHSELGKRQTEDIISSDRRFLVEPLKQFLEFLDAEKTEALVSGIYDDIIEEIGINLDQKTATRFIIHVCCMIERLMKGETLPYRGWEELKKREEKVFSAIEDKFVFIQHKFGVTVPPEEISYLVELFLAEMAQ